MIEQRLGEAPFFGGRVLSLADIEVWSLTTARTFRGGRIVGLPTPNLLGGIGRAPGVRRSMARRSSGMAPTIT